MARRPPLTLNKQEGRRAFTDGALREARRVVSVPLSLELWEYSLLDDGPQRALVKTAGAARALVGVLRWGAPARAEMGSAAKIG